MNKIIVVLIICLFSAVAVAEKTAEVTIRAGRQDNAVRVVLEAQEDFIKNANTITSLKSVRIDFPSGFELKKQKDFFLDVTHKDRFMVINIKDAADVKTYKLTAPGRIVIDIKTAPKEAAKPETKPAADKTIQKTSWTTAAVAKTSWATAAATGAKPATPGAPAQVQDKGKGKIKAIVIDAGHGGFDRGLLSGETKEKDISLMLSKELGAVLAKKGITVALTRKTDQPVSITDRINFIAAKKPDLLISLHATSSDTYAVYTSAVDESNTDTAVKIYSSSSRQNRHLEKSRLLAKGIGNAIKNELKGTVILREVPLPLLTSMDTPAVIVELPLTKTASFDQKTRDKLIKALTGGLAAYEQ